MKFWTSLALVAALSCGNGTGGALSSGSNTAPGTNQTFGPQDIITDKTYPGLLIEVDWLPGQRPADALVQRLESRLDALVQSGHIVKPAGIRVVLDAEVGEDKGDDYVYSFAQLDALAGQHRSLTPAAGEAGVYVLFTGGRYEGDSDGGVVLGFAYGGSVIVMLQENIDRSCRSVDLPGPLGVLADKTCELTAATVWMHEMGHLFGLVNNGLPMVTDHQDEEHGAHDDNEECLMFWLNERASAADLVAERLKGGNETTAPFDAACLADMMAAQQ